MPGSETACCANTGVTTAVDRITPRLRSLKLVIVVSFHVVGPVRMVRGPLMERLASGFRNSPALEIVKSRAGRRRVCAPDCLRCRSGTDHARPAILVL